MKKTFNGLEKFSHGLAQWTGTSWGFLGALAFILALVSSGPVLGYSALWQSLINDVTSVITFLMVFIIQRSQNKQSLAIQVKLNELILTKKEANNNLIQIEEASEEDIKAAHKSHVAIVRERHDGEE